MEIQGIVKSIGAVETNQSQDGHSFDRRKVLIETVEEYPQSLLLSLKGDLATNFAAREGQLVKAYLKFRTFENKEHTARFNDIQAWRIDY